MTRVWLKHGSKVQLGRGLIDIGGGVGSGGGGPVSSIPRFFAPNSMWNSKLPDNAEIVSDSNNYAQKLFHQIRYTDQTTPGSFYPSGWSTVVNSSQYSPPIWTVPPGTPRQKVTWMTNNQQGPPASSTLLNGLQQKFNSVPIPPGKTAAELRSNGTDQDCAIYDPSTKEIWEFWLFRDTWPSAYPGTGFTCGFGGYASNVELDDGIYQEGWGTRASGFSYFGGLMMMHEYLSGKFPHMLVCATIVTKIPHLAPATRHDAFATSGERTASTVDAVPEGLIVRLPPGYEPAPSAYPIVKMISDAVRDYGMVVGDATASTFSLYAENPKTINTGYQGQGIATNVWNGVLNDSSANMKKDLRNKIDWSLLQQVKWPQAGWPT